MADFDIVIRGGTLADGSGGPLTETDIAVRSGRIAALGKIAGRGAQEIDARGRLVTPGFVDIHTHYDGQATWDSSLAPSSWHGVTTAVMGNCGVGFAPVKREDREILIELMEGVEDIPGAVLHEGLDWDWNSFSEYLDALERRPHDIDFCAQLAHGPLRVYVMGKRAADLEPATPDDIARMRVLAADAMRAGAIGFTTSRTIFHKTVKGDFTPTLKAGEDELTGIAMGLADAGSGVIELISDFDDPQAEFAMLRRIVEKSKRPLSLSLLQAHAAPDNWRIILDKIAEAARDGLNIKGQVAPRPIGVLFGLQCSINHLARRPSYIEIQNRPLAEKLAAMRDPSFRARVQSETPTDPYVDRRLHMFEMMFPLGSPANYDPGESQSVLSLARQRGVDPAQLAYDMLLENEGRNFLFKPFANYAHYGLDHCAEMIAAPDTLMGLGDGGAHVGIISDASFPTHLLSYWGRDRKGQTFDLPFLVKRLTADNAAAVGLRDRGRIALGLKADLNVIDFDNLTLGDPVMAFDLPSGGKRLLQKARGYDATIVSGTVTYRNGQATGALPGTLVRGG